MELYVITVFLKLNSLNSVSKFLKKFGNNIELKKGNLLILDFGLSIQKYNFFQSNGSLNMPYLKNVFNFFY